MTILERIKYPGKFFKRLFKWGGLGLLTGVFGGLVGALFAHTLSFVTGLRNANPWLIFLLPVGGLATVGIYRLFGMRNNRGTNEIIDAILDNRPVKVLVAPVIFLATAITHLFGGSAGREGAALQLGGAGASALAKIFRLKGEERTILIMSGMSAVFAGLFGTPLTATLFTMEFESVGTIFSPALLPCYLSAFTASTIASLLGVHPEGMALNEVFSLNAVNDVKLLVLSIAIGLMGIVMCWVLHFAQHKAEHLLPNPWIRILVGAAVIIAMTLLVGSGRYNGAGMEVALEAIEGHANWYDFALKLLFTAVTLAAGFKGGEIVPTFCIGATFGWLMGTLLGMDPGFAAAFGLIGLFCAVTNSPVAAIVLSVEMFGSANLHVFALVCVIVFVMSGKWGLYSSQIFQFSHARKLRQNTDEENEG